MDKEERPGDMINTIKSLIETCVKALDPSDEKDVRETLFFVLLPMMGELQRKIEQDKHGNRTAL